MTDFRRQPCQLVFGSVRHSRARRPIRWIRSVPGQRHPGPIRPTVGAGHCVRQSSPDSQWLSHNDLQISPHAQYDRFDCHAIVILNFFCIYFLSKFCDWFLLDVCCIFLPGRFGSVFFIRYSLVYYLSKLKMKISKSDQKNHSLAFSCQLATFSTYLLTIRGVESVITGLLLALTMTIGFYGSPHVD